MTVNLHKTYLDYGFSSLLTRSLVFGKSISQMSARDLLSYADLPSSQMSIPSMATTDIVFSSTDYNTAGWTSGTIFLSNGGDSGTIDAGNTGNITDTTYVYWDSNRPDVLKTTTDIKITQREQRILMAIVELGESGKSCKITPLIGEGLTVTNLTADNIKSGTITTKLLTVASRGFVSTLVWTATDHDTASWAAGTLVFSDGTSYSISAGNTGNISALTYVYFDSSVSTTALQTTTTASTAVGDNKVPIAIVKNVTSGSKCIIDVIASNGTTIDGNRITTGKVQSADGNTYFDLDNKRIIMNDGSKDRLVIGDI